MAGAPAARNARASPIGPADFVGSPPMVSHADSTTSRACVIGSARMSLVLNPAPDGSALTRSACAVARLTPCLDELALFIELHDALSRALAMAVGDENVAIPADDDVGRRAELVGAVPRHRARADLQQDLAARAELRDLLSHVAARAAAVGRQRVGDPDVALLIHVDAVRERKQVGANVPDQVPVCVVVH